MLRLFFILVLSPLAALLSGCSAVVLQPSGDVAIQQRDLLIVSTVLMLLIIIPVMALVVLFAWRYRASNTKAEYHPEWDHSTKLELIIWSVPLLIIICLGAITWMSTHLLDPYRPLGRLSSSQSVSQSVKPLEIDVVALDWKWLFIYPEYGIATVNEMAAPTNRPINFRITSAAVMNSFYIPALAGQIYAMPGMETKLHAVMNKDGDYAGFSANYSGAGFSGMHFTFHSKPEVQFNQWVDAVKSSPAYLDHPTYMQLALPTENQPVIRYSKVDSDLYPAILNLCVEPGKMCMGAMMAIDARGGLGLAGIRNVAPLTYDKYTRPNTSPTTPLAADKTYVASICDPNEMVQKGHAFEEALPADLSPLTGYGLSQPSFSPAMFENQPSSTQPAAHQSSLL